MPERTLLVWLLIGLVTGAVARFAMPRGDPGGFVTTILIGISGALAAGFLVRAADWSPRGGWHEPLAALAGAVLLLALYRLIAIRRIK